MDGLRVESLCQNEFVEISERETLHSNIIKGAVQSGTEHANRPIQNALGTQGTLAPTSSRPTVPIDQFPLLSVRCSRG